MRRILALFLAIAMGSALLASCTSRQSTSGGNASGLAASGDNASGGGELAPATITVLFTGSTVSDDAKVVEAVNARLKELGTGITFKPIWGTWSDFDSKATTALDTGDANIDIMFTASWSANNYISYSKKGGFVRLDDPENDLLATYGQEVKAAVPQVLWDGFTIDGNDGRGIYAVPGYKDYAQMYTWDINNTRLSELGFNYDDFEWNSDTFYDSRFDEAMAAAKAQYGDDFFPLAIEAEPAARHLNNHDADPSGTILYLGFDPADPSKPEKPVITSRYDEPGYEKYINKIREYYLKGYIDPRSANAQQASDALTAQRLAGEYLFSTQTYAYGYDKTASLERGIDGRFPPISKAIVSTGSVQGAGYGISIYSKNQPQAMQFLNLWYTDSKLATLLAYGLEGTTYTTNADTTITFTDARASFLPWRNGMGNIFILPPEQESGPNYWKEFEAYNNAGVATALIGFVFDPEPVKNEIAAVTNVHAEYMLPLLVGAVDPAEKLPEFKEKLNANGAQKIIDEFNKQVEAFLSVK
ncbi:MAG: ABC transporter substrate-binding protein [Clostridiales bacterium]|jgi:putative aldouronate transport system substrate-binding protein|nr:ABC transporter substrate-binding protein [Clostridiales bacterium]